ncbi:MAG TPA: alpha/beta hydrolase, partial [Gemmatimonadales bacterium]|nr:alpha/beta hydrolase [Gemmatimonadales bacterium]
MLKTFSYGPNPSNRGDLYLPPQPGPPVVCLLHGGFWRMPYGKDQMSAIAGDLCARGFAVWNIEYRRIGEPQVGWSEMSSDVWAALEFLQGFSEREHRLDLNRASVVGHSAGGQLALACTTQQA